MSGGQVLGDYPIYKAVNDPGLLQYAHQLHPNATFIYRRWYDDNEQTRRLQEMQTDIPGAYNRWFAENAETIKAMPYAYHESYNEVGAPDQYLAFEKYRIERLASEGYKACVLNIGVGQTDAGMWLRAKAMVATAIQCGALIGEHSYAQTVMSANVGDSYWDANGQWHGDLFPDPAKIDPYSCHTGLRILQSKTTLAKQGQGAAVLVATELGWDSIASVYAPSSGRTAGFHDCVPVWYRLGWTSNTGTSPVAFARQQLDWWTRATGCRGVVYTVGTGGSSLWDSFNVSGLF